MGKIISQRLEIFQSILSPPLFCVALCTPKRQYRVIDLQRDHFRHSDKPLSLISTEKVPISPTIQPVATKEEFVTLSDDEVNEIDAVSNVDSDDHDVNLEIQPAQLIENGSLNVGSRVKVFWPDDNAFYKGTVARYSSRTGTHTIHYYDGDSEVMDMKKEQYGVVNNDNLHHEDEYDRTATANNVEITPFCELSSESESVLKEYRDHFGFKEFTSSQAQGLPRFVLHNAYVAQEKSYL